MRASEKKILEFVLRRHMVDRWIGDLRTAMEADGQRVAVVTGCGNVYSDQAARRFVADVLAAYDAYCAVVGERIDDLGFMESVESALRAHGREDAETGIGHAGQDAASVAEVAASSDPASLMDQALGELMPSMLYCLVRLVAESPFYNGTFGELKQACSDFAWSLSQGVGSKSIQAWELLARECGEGPCAPADLAECFLPSAGKFKGTYSDMVLDASGNEVVIDAFPSLRLLDEGGGEYGAGLTSWGPVSKDWLFTDLNRVYELLSGRFVSGGLPMGTVLGFEPGRAAVKRMLPFLNEVQARRVRALGWITDAEFDSRIRDMDLDCEQWFADTFGQDVPLDEKRAIIAEEQEERARWRVELQRRRSALLADERTQHALADLQKWAETFPDKEAWCKEYQAMRRAYFRLQDVWDGLDPLEQWEYPRPGILGDALECAIAAVLDERGISHIACALPSPIRL